MVKESKKEFKIVFFSIIILLIMFASLIIPDNVIAFGLNKEYSSVLEDLEKDKNFNRQDYPAKDNDYSLNVIQIAESVKDESNESELYIYVYQPLGDKKEILASSINISIEIENPKYKNYTLALLSHEGVFYKYKVNLFKVQSTDEVRYYEISSIFRHFINGVDETVPGNTITEVSYEVGQKWAVGEKDGDLVYECMSTETILIKDKFVGFVFYKGGFSLMPSSCNSHFIAFNTDKPIDRLLEAEVYYTEQKYTYYTYFAGNKYYDFKEKEEKYTELNYTDKASYEGSIWLAKHTFTWNRIEKTNDFINNENVDEIFHCGFFDVGFHQELDKDVVNQIKNMQWVLRFSETEYTDTYYPNSAHHVIKGTLIGDVSILRLKFETDNVTYNLGAIDNKSGISDPLKPSNNSKFTFSLSNKLKAISTIIITVIVILVLAYITIVFIKAVNNNKKS